MVEDKVMMPLGVEFCRALRKAGVGHLSVIEIGSKPAPGQEQIANLRPIFDAAVYCGVDVEAGRNVDLVCEGERVDQVVGKVFELGLTIDTLEHCWDPGKVVLALSRVCEHIAFRAPFAAPIHNHPSDYWRFTPATFARWLKATRAHGFVAKDPSLFSYPGEWAHSVYGFGTDSPEARVKVLRALPSEISVVGYW